MNHISKLINLIACLPRITFPSCATIEGRERFHNNATFYMSIYFVDSFIQLFNSLLRNVAFGWSLSAAERRKKMGRTSERTEILSLMRLSLMCERNGKMINFHPSNFQVILSRMITHSLSLKSLCLCKSP